MLSLDDLWNSFQLWDAKLQLNIDCTVLAEPEGNDRTHRPLLSFFHDCHEFTCIFFHCWLHFCSEPKSSRNYFVPLFHWNFKHSSLRCNSHMLQFLISSVWFSGFNTFTDVPDPHGSDGSQENHGECGLWDWLLSLSVMLSMSIHVIANTSFFLGWIPLYGCIFCCCCCLLFMHWWLLGYFGLLAIASNAAVNVGVHI